MRIASEDAERIDGILGTLSETPPESKIVETLFLINRHFGSDQFEDILASLEGDESEWAMRELASLRSKSPQTCKVALRQLADSIALADFADNMAMEYRIASRVIVRPDFTEGVRAVIVDKDNAPKWDPATAEDVTADLIDAIFAPLSAQEEWKPL
jgi:enoyl-CoA hydratase